MNHLAHVHLSGPDDHLVVGNLAADYLRKRECLELPVALQDGVALHRHIDHATDNHPAVRRAWAVLRGRHGKYASVVYDIYADYLLHRHWSRFAERPMEEVVDNAYAALRRHADQLPDALAARFARMTQSNWLMQYGSYEGQAYVFERFGARLSRPELLAGVIDTLRDNETALAAAFHEFYPSMLVSSRALARELAGPKSGEG